MNIALLTYAIGFGIALIRTDASPAVRLVLAALWPLGPIAFVVTVSVLLAASLIAFPLVGLIAAAIALLTWFIV